MTLLRSWLLFIQQFTHLLCTWHREMNITIYSEWASIMWGHHPVSVHFDFPNSFVSLECLLWSYSRFMPSCEKLTPGLHMTQTKAVRAFHPSGHSNWLRDGPMPQGRPVRHSATQSWDFGLNWLGIFSFLAEHCRHVFILETVFFLPLVWNLQMPASLLTSFRSHLLQEHFSDYSI